MPSDRGVINPAMVHIQTSPGVWEPWDGATSGGGGGAMTVADGADVAEGSTSDAVVAAGAAGTVSAKLRRLTTDIATLLAHTDGIETLLNGGLPALASGRLPVELDAAALAALETITIGTALPAGTNAIGKLAANSGVDIGDVDVTSIAAGENHLGEVGGKELFPTANFTRPSDTTAYASGDLVANSTTAGSVTPLSWTATRVSGGTGMVRRARLKKSGTGITNASFRLHLYAADPSASSGITNGDNGAWLTKHASHLGAIDITVDKAFSDAAGGNGVPLVGSEINFTPASGSTIYGLLEARGSYTPASAEVFTVDLEILAN